MARYMILALNGPTDGSEAEAAFNRWYDEVHLPELRSVEGIVSTRRFKVMHSNTAWPYAAAYEVETDDLPATMAAMTAAMGSFPPEFDQAASANLVAIDITRD